MKKLYLIIIVIVLLVVGYIIGAKDNKPVKEIDASTLPSRFD